MQTRTMARVGVLSSLLLLVGGTVWLIATDNPWRDQEDSGLKIGDVRLELTMTYKDLRERLGTGSDYMNVYTNATTVVWRERGMVVWATFWVASPEKIRDELAPIEMKVGPGFKGEFCGLRVGSSMEAARTTIETRYPDVAGEKGRPLVDQPSYFRRGKKLNTRWEFTIDKTHRITVEGIDDRVERIESETQGIGIQFH